MVEESESLGSIGAIGMADSAPSYDSAQSAPTPSAAAIAQQSAGPNFSNGGQGQPVTLITQAI